MLVIGLTGGIGSGKTTVSNLFASYDITIIDADVLARESVAAGTKALDQITLHFGQSILLSNGDLDRAKLRKIVFDSETEKLWLEKLIHPIVRANIEVGLQSSTSIYSILSSPLLLETDQHTLCSRIAIVDVTRETQLFRASTRDGNSTQQIERIIAAQMNRERRLSFADDIIDNNGSLESTKRQVQMLHERYVLEANQKNEC